MKRKTHFIVELLFMFHLELSVNLDKKTTERREMVL